MALKCICVILVATLCTNSTFGKERPRITIQVVSSQTAERSAVTGKCETIFGVTKCGVRGSSKVQIESVFADGKHATLECVASLHRCRVLAPGTYEAEIDGDRHLLIPTGEGKKTLRYEIVGYR